MHNDKTLLTSETAEFDEDAEIIFEAECKHAFIEG